MLLQPTECKTLPKRKLLTKCKQKQRENTTTGCGFRRNNHSKHNACTAKANYIENKCPSKPTQNANLPTTGWAFGTQRRKALAWLTHLVCAISLPRGGFAKKSKAKRLALCELLTSTILSFLLRTLPAKSALRPASICTSLSSPMGWACCKRKRLPEQSRCRPCNTAKCH